MRIGERWVGEGHKPFVIAEMSGNHGGSLERALAIVDAAARAGVDAVKLQTYTADTMTLDADGEDFQVLEEGSLWRGARLYDLYERAHTPWEWHRPLFDRIRSHGLVAFSTPFDTTAVEFLEQLDVPCYKIASFENVDIPLIRRVAATRKPMIISTGMASVDEIAEAVTAAREAGCRELALLKCTSSYPASPESSNLAAIPVLRTMFDCEVGLSDHTLGIGVAVASVALGGSIIEKHMTLERGDGAVDSDFSAQPEELRMLVEECERAWQARGVPEIGPAPSEIPSLKYRRSLYFVRSLRAGDRIGPEDVRAIRPGMGLAPKHLEAVMGRVVAVDVERATPVAWELLA